MNHEEECRALRQDVRELRHEIVQLRNDLAEVDGLLACHAHKLDPNPRERWPRDSVLGKAIDRHEGKKRP